MTSSLHIKRKAEADLQTPPAKQLRRNDVGKYPPAVIGRISQEGSLNYIIHNHPHLYVDPIAWTFSDHLKELDCSFVKMNDDLPQQPRSSCDTDNTPSRTIGSELSSDAQYVRWALGEFSTFSDKGKLLQEILRAYDLQPAT